MIQNDRSETEEGLKLAKIFMQIKDRAQRQRVLALAEQILREQSQASDGAIPPSAEIS